MLTINKEFLKSHKCYKGKNNPKYIVNHETDNYSEGAGARNHAKAQFNGNLGDASVHFYVDDKEIYQLIIDLANKGKGVIMVSSEMPELLGICDRILVMSNGKVAGIEDTDKLDQEKIMTLAAKYI